YLRSQRLARLATVRPDGTPQIAPVGFHYNAELDVIEIGGRYLSQTKKVRNLQQNPHVALVIDDVLPPWEPCGGEIRGTAQTFSTGGQALFGTNYAVDDAVHSLPRAARRDATPTAGRAAGGDLPDLQ